MSSGTYALTLRRSWLRVLGHGGAAHRALRNGGFRAFLPCVFARGKSGYGLQAHHSNHLRSKSLERRNQHVTQSLVGPVPRVGHFPFAAYRCRISIADIPPGCAGCFPSRLGFDVLPVS